jgi:two-component system, chemotaxis family, protein-glutamate methylesterase/glutaminase
MRIVSRPLHGRLRRESQIGPMDTPTRYGLVAIAASAGGIPALQTLLSTLPRNLPVPVAVVLHRSRRELDLLPMVLGRWSTLPVRPAEPGKPVQPGTVYVAPADAHLVVGSDCRFELMDGRRIQHLLSSANPLFATAAQVLGPVIGVVLTGMGQDGTDGVQAVKQAGGIIIAQDEATSEWFSMPRSAIATGLVDYVLPLDRIGAKLVELLDHHAGLTPTGATS